MIETPQPSLTHPEAKWTKNGICSTSEYPSGNGESGNKFESCASKNMFLSFKKGSVNKGGAT